MIDVAGRTLGAAQRLADRGGGARGTLVGFPGTAARIAAAGGSLEVGRLRVGGGAKLAAAEAGLEAGVRLA